MMATAARTTIAEVEQLVDTGALAPDLVHTPGIFVQHDPAGHGATAARVEKRTVRA